MNTGIEASFKLMIGAGASCNAVHSNAHFKLGALLDSIAGPWPQVLLTWGEGFWSGGASVPPWQGGFASAGADVCGPAPTYSPRQRAPHWEWIAITRMRIEQKLFINGYRNRRISQQAIDKGISDKKFRKSSDEELF